MLVFFIKINFSVTKKMLSLWCNKVRAITRHIKIFNPKSGGRSHNSPNDLGFFLFY